MTDFGRRYKNLARGARSDGGFTAAELIVVALVVTVLIIVLFSGMGSLIYNARLTNVKQEAAGIGAAIEILKEEGRFDPGDERLPVLINGLTESEYKGGLSEIKTDGSFIYSRTEGGESFIVRYDSASGSVEEVS